MSELRERVALALETAAADIRAGRACLPEWDVWEPDQDEDREDARRFRAVDAEQAARVYLESDWDNDDTITVCVAAPGSDEVERWSVTRVPSVEYHARRLEGRDV